MSTATALTLLDELPGEQVAREFAVRTQVAFVRTLIDAINRGRWPAGKALALGSQLDEEVARLTRMLGDRARMEPLWGSQLGLRAVQPTVGA
jgi:hypothetical protein